MHPRAEEYFTRALLAYKGGEGSEITSFASLPRIGEILWLIPPSERGKTQATRERMRVNPRTGRYGDYLPYVVQRLSFLRDGTPRIEIAPEKSLYLSTERVSGQPPINPQDQYEGVEATLYFYGYAASFSAEV